VRWQQVCYVAVLDWSRDNGQSTGWRTVGEIKPLADFRRGGK